LVQLYAGGNMVYVFDVAAIGDLGILNPLWDRPLVAHNAVFELKHLLHAGANPKKVGCTMLQANALDGNLPSLAELAKIRLGWEMDKELQVSDWGATTLSSDQIAYAALDAVVVLKIHPIQLEALAKETRNPVYALMRDAQRAIAKLELNGIYFDATAHVELMTRWKPQRLNCARSSVRQ
jgi:DNA polymerase-1